MIYTLNSPFAEALQRRRHLRGAATRLLLNIAGDDFAVAPGERPVVEVADLGNGLVRTRPGIARLGGDEMIRRAAPIGVPALPWACDAPRGSDEERAHRAGGVLLRPLRGHERQSLTGSDTLAPMTSRALESEHRATRGGRHLRIIVEVRAVARGAIRRSLWAIPAGQLRAATNPRNQWAQQQRRAGQVPDGWHRI